MATDLGKVGMRMRGDWSSSATYEVLDAVQYNNGTYIAKQAVPANTVPTNTTYWQSAINSAIIGTTSIAGIGDGTLTGAVAMLNGRIKEYDVPASSYITIEGVNLPKVYLVATYGAAGGFLAIAVGVGYGQQSSRHKIEEIISGNAIAFSQSESSYGIKITNSAISACKAYLVTLSS